MDLEEISFEGKILTVGDKTFDLEYPVSDAVLFEDRAIVLFDHMAQEEAGQFNNLIAIDMSGNRI